jgi:hypothetical protein
MAAKNTSCIARRTELDRHLDNNSLLACDVHVKSVLRYRNNDHLRSTLIGTKTERRQNRFFCNIVEAARQACASACLAGALCWASNAF